MATTHTEIYRLFEGELKPRAMRYFPLFLAQVRVRQKKKLPLLLLYAPPAIATIVFSFVVYSMFSLEAQMDGESSGPNPLADPKAALAVAMARGVAQQLLEVRSQIVEANLVLQGFSMLAIAWFGAGLISEDRRLGAHLLYFSRPMTKLDYFLGHFLTVSYFGLLSVLVPTLVICLVATFSSPEFSFLREEWDVIPASIAHALLTVALLASITLAISCVVKRKAFALVGLFGMFAGAEIAGAVLSKMTDDDRFLMLDPWNHLLRIGDWMLSIKSRPSDLVRDTATQFDWSPYLSLGVVGGLIALALGVCWFRLRKLEGVG